MTARVLVTGSRSWPDAAAVEAALLEAWHDALQAGHDGIVVVHGGCPTGADRLAWEWAAARDVMVEVHVAGWAQHGRAAGPLRNQAMVAAGAVVCLAFPLGRSVGTRDCMRRAAAAGIPVRDLGARR
ncbi:DUF2493 domain-containing protein [Kitasatospora sp. NBC_01287]|uniref:SLOG family protein n=1 Tax=Kitasatospora sp. NBC_01287 TaxID=2903573 RepID=UPI00224FD9FE|nr:SLOG family protein [Kitasatospora sp. NBC_01287]MCX4751732.1 DUF2493 domain-containing protein [Kitasatospora sp. NBC_01287]MCX4751976.1 DUF2493 domain-containing protein [Kitasatospora sp. NBC_01287]